MQTVITVYNLKFAGISIWEKKGISRGQWGQKESMELCGGSKFQCSFPVSCPAAICLLLTVTSRETLVVVMA